MTDEAANDLDAEALIELYFELEDEDEREVVLDKLESFDLPMVTEFWRAAAHEDDDELVRVRALTVLSKRGDGEALAGLKATIDDPDDIIVFEEALQAVAAIEGATFFPAVEAIWRDDSRDADERRAAMTVMESVDAEKTLRAFDAFVATLGDAATFPDDQIEVVLLAYLRGEHVGAVPLLESMLERLTASSRGMDEDERDELLGMVREGIELLRAPTQLRP
ncbi:MAG: HEAT repeat domain-containing protein [Myxococcota bacterium]